MAENLPNRHSVSRVLTPIALSIMLVACGGTPDQPSQPTTNEQAVEQNAAYYLLKADQSSGSEQVDWLLVAFDASINEGNLELSERIMRRLAQSPMTAQQQAQWQLTRAKLLLAKDQPTDAIRQLNFQPSWVLDDQTWATYHQVRADIYFALFDPQSGLVEMIQRFSYLPTDQRQAHSDEVWQRLLSLNESDLASIQANGDTELAGWLSLAYIANAYPGDFANLKRRYELFLNENFDHSAAYYTPTEIQEILAMDIVTASNTALLLPLTGKYAKQAGVIRDGFLFALMNDGERDDTLRYSIIDSNGKSIEQIEQELNDNQADFIVGPLQKETIDELQASQQEKVTPIPMLALNFPEEILENDALCYVTLAPEQEATEAANHLHALGYRFPLFIAPNSSYGRRMVESFEAQWQTLTNTPTDKVLFKNQRELQYVINGAFDLRNSEARIAQLNTLFDTELEAEARSRRDVDAVYIVAKDSDLNLIKPFIDVAINPEAQAPKVFASSYSNSGSNRSTLDLTGVTYSDIPFLASPDAKVKANFEFIWEEASHAQKRLYALGMDAYALTHALPNMKLDKEFSLQGQTGVLTIDERCVVERQLSWAEYGVETTPQAEADVTTLEANDDSVAVQ